jgi:hypothetical protein
MNILSPYFMRVMQRCAYSRAMVYLASRTRTHSLLSGAKAVSIDLAGSTPSSNPPSASVPVTWDRRFSPKSHAAQPLDWRAQMEHNARTAQRTLSSGPSCATTLVSHPSKSCLKYSQTWWVYRRGEEVGGGGTSEEVEETRRVRGAEVV